MLSTEVWLTSAAYAIVLGLLLFFVSQPLMGILQQEGYSGTALIEWWYRKNELSRRYAMLALSGALATAILSLCFSFGGTAVSTFIAMLGYAGLIALFVYAFRHALKVPLRRTMRVVRLSVCYYVLLAFVFFVVEILASCIAAEIGHPLAMTLLRAVPVTILPFFLPNILVGANFIMEKYEVPHTRKFIALATEKLAASDSIKVGITGSFGKTSVKRFAAEILAKKYRVQATPASYNTPVGIAKFVNEEGCECDIFLAEMGARKRGDIQELCDMVCPSFAVVTGICPQHLESFGSLEAIEKEKGVLANYAKNVVLGKSAEGLLRENVLFEGRDFGAENIVCTTNGTSFDLILGGERIAVTTKLLGRHAAEDLALAAVLAFMLGMVPSEIAEAIPEIAAVPHRLEHIEENGLHILDDSYNSNIEGAKDAVETLKLFAGKKYVVTPGLVELGELKEKANANLGAQFVGLDGVILIGETLVLSVRQGYLDAGGEEGKLRVVPTLTDAKAILAEELAPGDAVLFLNDLPDKYN